MTTTKLEAITMALATRLVEPSEIYICQGPARCIDRPAKTGHGCQWCHIVPMGDRRTAEQIMKDMERQQHGH